MEHFEFIKLIILKKWNKNFIISINNYKSHSKKI